MVEYNYIETLTLPELNALANNEHWQVLQVEKGDGGAWSKVFLVRGITADEQVLNETVLVEGQNDNNFYFKKNIDAGDVIIIMFLAIFLVFGITKFLLDFIIPKRMNFKK